MNAVAGDLYQRFKQEVVSHLPEEGWIFMKQDSVPGVRGWTMTTAEPAEAIQGTKVGAICDRCNRRVKSGDPVRFYATVYPHSGWTLRRLYCSDCGERTIEPKTSGTDEVVGEAVFWRYHLAAVRIMDQSYLRNK